MDRLTKWSEASGAYVVSPEAPQGRSMIQELGIYEDIHSEEIEKATNIGNIRDTYIKKGVKLDPYWETYGNFGDKEV